MTNSPDEPKGHLLALNHVQEAILSGDLQVGDRLPGERDIALELGISRGAVREAMRVMQAYGILESQPGPGRGTRITAMQSRALGTMFSLHLATATQSREDLSETRIGLERATATLAAQRWSGDDLAHMHEQVLRMDETHELAAFNDLDTAFHQEIAHVAGNTLLADLTVAIREALRNPILRASLAMDDWAKMRVGLCQQHRAIMEAVEARDGALAADLVEAHIRQAAHQLFTS